MRLELCFLGNETFNASSRKPFVLCASDGRFPLYYVRIVIHRSFDPPFPPRPSSHKNEDAASTTLAVTAKNPSKAPASASAGKKETNCKAPGAPKRFKSAFIFFTMHRHKTIRKEIEEKLGKGDRVSILITSTCIPVPTEAK